MLVRRWLCWCCCHRRRNCRCCCSLPHCCYCYYCWWWWCCHYSHSQWPIRGPTIVCQRLPSISHRPHDSISNRSVPFHSTWTSFLRNFMLSIWRSNQTRHTHAHTIEKNWKNKTKKKQKQITATPTHELQKTNNKKVVLLLLSTKRIVSSNRNVICITPF